jgi:hypothetical protein
MQITHFVQHQNPINSSEYLLHQPLELVEEQKKNNEKIENSHRRHLQMFPLMARKMIIRTV